MLESLARCLRIRGHDAVPIRTHHAFWCHGAEFIQLPAWWRLYLQQSSSPSENLLRQPYAGTPWSRLLRRSLRRLTWPLRHLAFIRNIRSSSTLHQQATETNRSRSRRYALLAQVVLLRSLTRAYSSQDPSVGARDSTEDSEIIGQEVRARRSEFTAILDGPADQRDAEQLWQIYNTLSERHAIPPATDLRKFLRLLDASDLQVDAERLIAVFQSIDVNVRRPVHYSYAISAALKLNDIDTALYFHREAIVHLQAAAGASNILRFVIGRENWDVAIALWETTRDLLSVDSIQDGIWADSRTLPFSFLAERAVLAAQFAQQNLPSDAIFNAEPARNFAECLLRLCISVRGSRVNLTHWKAVSQALMELCRDNTKETRDDIRCDCLDQVLSVQRPKHDQAALRAYLETCDEDPGFMPRYSTWRVLFERSAKPVTALALIHLIQQWRERHGVLCCADYLYALDASALAGDIETYSVIFQAYRDDHPKDTSDIINLTTLEVHHQRSDPDGVVKAFQRLTETRGYEVNVEHHNTVVRTFARSGDAEGALAWFRHSQSTGVSLNHNSYTALMGAYAKLGDSSTVSDLYYDALLHNLQPDQPMFDTLVRATVQDGRLDKAQRILEEAPKNFSKEFLTTVWNRLLYKRARRSDLVAVKLLHARMQEVGVPSDEITYAALALALSMNYFPQNAQKLVRKIMPELGLEAGPIHYAEVMKGFMRTREYRRVFLNYQQLLSLGHSPDMTIKNLVLQAGARIDNADGKESADEVEKFPLARRILSEIINDLDPAELASMDSFKYVGFERLDESWISGYFDTMMMQYASANALSHVSELFDLYVQTAQKFSARDVASSPPLKILSALLVCHGKAGNHEGVLSCWETVMTKCEQLSRSSKWKDEDKDRKRILGSRQLIINHPLKCYLDYLATTGRFKEMEQVVVELFREGYELSHANMNLYIQYLCQSPHREQQLLALRLCEKYLMNEWWGWDSMKLPYIGSYFKATEKRIGGTRLRAPKYRTLVCLAKAFLDLGFGKSDQRKSAELMTIQASGEISRTLSSIQNMPRLDDRVQIEILGFGSE